jgi:hypothetical protein
MCLLVFDELLFVLLGQAREHQAEHGQVDHGLTATGLVLVILAHATRATDPGQSALDIPTMLSYISEIMTLEPGDIIATGTPSGVGYARNPQVFLKPGDVVQVEIAELGVLENPVIGPQGGGQASGQEHTASSEEVARG